MIEWFTATELAGLPGMPPDAAGVNEIAKREGWESRDREWMSAKELAGLPGVPQDEHGVREMASRENWKSRVTDDGVRQYHSYSFPEDTYADLFPEVAQFAYVISEVSKAFDQYTEEEGLEPWPRLLKAQLIDMMIYQAFMRMKRPSS